MGTLTIAVVLATILIPAFAEAAAATCIFDVWGHTPRE